MNLNIEILSKAADQARALCMDAVQASQSGHLGLPLGCAEMGAVLFGHALKYNPDQPRWINRDIFVLSAGHGSMFLYAWLHMSGYDLPMSEIKRSGNCIPRHPDTPNLATHPEWNAPPDRSARAWATRWACPWLRTWLRRGSTPMRTEFSTSTWSVCAVTATCRRASHPRRARSPAFGASTI